jgi:hypothetical protein
MEHQPLSVRLLDTAIKAMERNRTLLFTINMVAALIFVVVYLERFSFDMKQGQGHLIAYKGRCQELNNSLASAPGWQGLSEDDKKVLAGCSDLEKIRGFIVVNVSDQTQIQYLSNQLFRLHIIRNEMNNSKLPGGNVMPLGIGLSIPRNDMVIICGFLLVVLYAWLAFSFAQLARITTKIKQLFPEAKIEECNGTQATVSDLVDVNFLFRTDEGGMAALMVRILYLLAPISMTIATLNNLYLDTTKSFGDYLNSVLQVPLMIQGMIVVVLWMIGYHVNKSDKEVNIASRDEMNNKSK